MALALGPLAGAQDVKTLSTVAVIWALWALTNLYRSYKQARLDAAGRPGAAKLMRPITGLVKLLILIFGMLFWLNNISVNITTVLAGLGVGGLAVALALQNTVVSIPNARIAHVEAENLTYRSRIRYWPTLRLRYDTTLEQLRQIRDRIREMLEANESVYEEPVRVRFTDFDTDAILIKVHCCLKTTDYTESLKIGDAFNLSMMEIVQSVGARFALPGRSISVEGEAVATPG